MKLIEVIDLSGPQGNANSLIGLACMTANRLGLDTQSIGEDMTSGNYEHLLSVFEKHFGDRFKLINKPGEDEAHGGVEDE